MSRAEEAQENFQLIYISLLIVRHNLINSILHPPEDYRPTLLTPPSGSYKAGNAANKSHSELGAGEAVSLGHLPQCSLARAACMTVARSENPTRVARMPLDAGLL